MNLNKRISQEQFVRSAVNRGEVIALIIVDFLNTIGKFGNQFLNKTWGALR